MENGESIQVIYNSSLHFVSFNGGPLYTWLASWRLSRELKNSEAFSSFKIYKPRDLGLSNPEILSEVTKTFIENSRGFGYWLWKPAIIKDKLSSIRVGDYIIYADVGCEINSYHEAKKIIFEMELKNLPILWSPNSPRGYGIKTYGAEEKKWTKQDLIDRLGLDNNQKDSRQIGATWLIVRKSEQTVELIERWLSLCLEEQGRFLNDMPSEALEDKEFVEHRHDQSILSCLIKAETEYFEKVEAIEKLGNEIEAKWIKPSRNFSLFSSDKKSRIHLLIKQISEKIKYMEIRLMKRRFWRKFLLSLKQNRF
jgi:hypothetical protein